MNSNNNNEKFINIKPKKKKFKNKWNIAPLNTIFEEPTEEDIKLEEDANKKIFKGDKKWDPDIIFDKKNI